MGGSVWNQVWISGVGWIPVEASYPVCDYVRPSRTYVSKILSPAEHAVAAVSGRDGDVGRVLWDPQIKAYYMKSSPQELKDYRQIASSKILLTKIVSEGHVPDNAKIQMGEDIYVCARQREGKVVLVFQDKAGRELKNVPLFFEGLSSIVNINNRLFWKYIPRRIGEILVIENLECKTVPESSSSSIPGQERGAIMETSLY